MTSNVGTYFEQALLALNRRDSEAFAHLLGDGAVVRIGSAKARREEGEAKQWASEIMSGLCAAYDAMTWELARLVVGSDGWGAAVVAMSGVVRRGYAKGVGDLTVRRRYAWMAHAGDVGVDHLHLHGLPQIDAESVLSPSEAAAEPAVEGSLGAFLEAYAAGDPHRMTRACAIDAAYRGPWDMSGVRSARPAIGYVATDGKPFWRGFFDAFEDLRVVTGQVIVAPSSAAAEVTMSGRQVQPWLRTHNLGGSFCASGVLFFTFDAEGRINAVEEAIDGALIEAQLLAPRADDPEPTTSLVGARS